MKMHLNQQPRKHPACREMQREIVQFAGGRKGRKKGSYTTHLSRSQLRTDWKPQPLWKAARACLAAGQPLSWHGGEALPARGEERLAAGSPCLPLRSDPRGSLPVGKQVAAALIYLIEKKKLIKPETANIRDVCISTGT